MKPANSRTMEITRIENGVDYELKLVRSDETGESAVRLAAPGVIDGVVVNYLHKEDDIYKFSGRALCSPDIIKLPSGALLASMDVFKGDYPQNMTLVMRSDDRGATWRYVCDLYPCYWGRMFLHNDRLYMLSTQTEYGDILIGASDDEGETWCAPTHLFAGTSSNKASGWQLQPMPVIEHGGRVITSVDFGGWAKGFHEIGMLFARAGSDLLDPANWFVSGVTGYDPSWPGAPKGRSSGLLEGNMLIAPDGSLVDILRIQLGDGSEPSHGIAVQVKFDIANPEKAPVFDRIVELPSGSNSKTYILRDDATGWYFAAGNIVTNPETPHMRSVLAIEASPDLVNWKVVETVIDHREEDPSMTGFQYPTFIFDGDDILLLSRTSRNGAANFHDANQTTFHIIKDFRKYAK